MSFPCPRAHPTSPSPPFATTRPRARRDYDQNPELDTYSQADIDDENEYGQMSARERREAEREMEKRDRGATGGQSTKPKAKAWTPASSPGLPRLVAAVLTRTSS